MLGDLQRRVTTAVTDLRANTRTITLPFQSRSYAGNVANPHVADVGDPRYPLASPQKTDFSGTDARNKWATVALKAASTARMVDALTGGRIESTVSIDSAPRPSPRDIAKARQLRTEVEASTRENFVSMTRQYFPKPVGGPNTLDAKAYEQALPEFNRAMDALPASARRDVMIELSRECKGNLANALPVLNRLRKPLMLDEKKENIVGRHAWRVAQQLSLVSPGGIRGIMALQGQLGEDHVGHKTHAARLLVFLQAGAALCERRPELGATPREILNSTWPTHERDGTVSLAHEAIAGAAALSKHGAKEDCTPAQFAAFKMWQWGARTNGAGSPFESAGNLAMKGIQEFISSSANTQAAADKLAESFSLSTSLLSWPGAKLRSYNEALGRIFGWKGPAPFHRQEHLMGTDLLPLEDRQHAYDSMVIAARSGLIGHFRRTLPEMTDAAQMHENALGLALLITWEQARPSSSVPRPETFAEREPRPEAFYVSPEEAGRIWANANALAQALVSNGGPTADAASRAVSQYFGDDRRRNQFVNGLAGAKAPFGIDAMRQLAFRTQVSHVDAELAGELERTFAELEEMSKRPGAPLDQVTTERIATQWKALTDKNSRGLGFNAADGAARGIQGFFIAGARPLGVSGQATHVAQSGYGVGSDNAGFQVMFSETSNRIGAGGANYVGGRTFPLDSTVVPAISLGFLGGGSISGNQGKLEEAVVFRASLQPRALNGQVMDDEKWRNDGKEMVDAIFTSANAARDGKEFIEEFAWRTSENPRIAMLTRTGSSLEGRANVSFAGNARVTVSPLENPPALGLFGGITATSMLRGSNTVETGEFPIVNVDTEYRTWLNRSISLGLSMPGFSLLEHAGPETPHAGVFTVAGASWDFARAGTTSNVYAARDSLGVVPRLTLYDTYYRGFNEWKDAVLQSGQWKDEAGEAFLEQLFEEAQRQTTGGISWGIRTGLNPDPERHYEDRLNVYLSALDRIDRQIQSNPPESTRALLFAQREELKAGMRDTLKEDHALRPVALFGLATTGQATSTGAGFLARATREQSDFGNSLSFLHLHPKIWEEIGEAEQTSRERQE